MSPTYYIFVFTLGLQRPTPPPVGQELLIIEDSPSHTTTHPTRYDSSGRVISPSHRPLPDNTQHSQQTDIHAPQRVSNAQSQKASGRRTTS